MEIRHDNVKRTIDTLVSRGVIVQPQIEDEPGFDAMGRPRSIKVYLINQRDSYVIVAQTSWEYTLLTFQERTGVSAATPANALPFPRN